MLRSLLALSLCALTACAPEEKDDSGWRSSNRATRLLDEHVIDCEFLACPASVGVLVRSTITSAGTCTTWIAGEYEGKTVVITNRHCVEDMFNCAEEVAVKFPRTRETAQCLRTLRVSEFALGSKQSEPNRVPDYAVLQLDRRLNEAPLPISQAGLAPMTDSITLRKAWVQGDRWIEMREERCATGTAGLLTPDYTSALSPNISTFGCRVKGGVSGSPVLNPAGEVAAMIQIGPADQASSRAYDPRFDMSAMNQLMHGAATNLACVNSPEIGLVRSPSCNLPADYVGTRMGDYAARLMKQNLLESEMLKRIEAFEAENPTGLFRWDVRPDEEASALPLPGQVREVALELVPKCVLHPDAPGSKTGAVKGPVDIRVPGFAAKFKADRYGTLSVDLREKTKYATYTVDPKPMFGSTIVDENVLGRERRLYLPTCPRSP